MMRSPVRALISPLCTTLFSYRVGLFVAVRSRYCFGCPGAASPRPGNRQPSQGNSAVARMACAGCCVVPADARYGPALEFAGATARSNRPHHPAAAPARRALLDADRFQARRSALSREGLGLLLGPPVAGESARVRAHAALDHQKPARG